MKLVHVDINLTRVPEPRMSWTEAECLTDIAIASVLHCLGPEFASSGIRSEWYWRDRFDALLDEEIRLMGMV